MDEHAHTHPAADGSASKDRAAGHGMVVVGTETVFFSHLPMFMSPHDYQVILEGTLSQEGTDLPKAYKDDRVGQPAATVYTAIPLRSFSLTSSRLRSSASSSRGISFADTSRARRSSRVNRCRSAAASKSTSPTSSTSRS
jgi:hypothetical protein